MSCADRLGEGQLVQKVPRRAADAIATRPTAGRALRIARRASTIGTICEISVRASVYTIIGVVEIALFAFLTVGIVDAF